jgi:type IV pilus assembly protein PilB
MRQKLGQMLIEAGVIDEMQLRSALADQRRWGRPLGKTLVEMRLVSEDDMVEILARQLNVMPINLDTLDIPQDVLDLVPMHIAQQHAVIPFSADQRFIELAMADPTNLGVIDEVRIRTQLNVRGYLAGPRMIERTFDRCYKRNPRAISEVGIELDASISGTGYVVEPATPGIASQEPQMRDGLRTFRPPTASTSPRDREIDALQARLSALESLVQRDEAVLRKLLALLIDKGIATREEIIERLG